ncbi:MAG: hypothetical protein WC602_01460 [archaeon]
MMEEELLKLSMAVKHIEDAKKVAEDALKSAEEIVGVFKDNGEKITKFLEQYQKLAEEIQKFIEEINKLDIPENFRDFKSRLIAIEGDIGNVKSKLISLEEILHAIGSRIDRGFTDLHEQILQVNKSVLDQTHVLNNRFEGLGSLIKKWFITVTVGLGSLILIASVLLFIFGK